VGNILRASVTAAAECLPPNPGFPILDPGLSMLDLSLFYIYCIPAFKRRNLRSLLGKSGTSL
jgi:hypothetical protein